MPVVDYSKTVIYKIQHKSKDELLYVGSTTHFGNRKVQHKSRCYNPNEKIYNNKLYSTIRDNGGWDAFNMVIVKEFPCENKRQAEAEEDKVMRETQSSLNMVRSFVSEEEKLEHRKDYDKEYYMLNKDTKIKEYIERNRDKILLQMKTYREQHSDYFKQKYREYHERNKTRKNIYHKEYYYKNRDKAHEKHTCPCGGKYTHQHKASHFKTKKHQEYLNQQTDQ